MNDRRLERVGSFVPLPVTEDGMVYVFYTMICVSRHLPLHCTVPVSVVVGEHLAGDDAAVLLHQRQVSAEPPLAAAKTTSPLPGVEVFAAMAEC